MYISYSLDTNIGNKNRCRILLLYRKLWHRKLAWWSGDKQ